MKLNYIKFSLVFSFVLLFASAANAEDLFGWPQRYTESSVEHIYDMGTGCLTIIEKQYETTDCPIAPTICLEGTEYIMTHESTICPK